MFVRLINCCALSFVNMLNTHYHYSDPQLHWMYGWKLLFIKQNLFSILFKTKFEQSFKRNLCVTPYDKMKSFKFGIVINFHAFKKKRGGVNYSKLMMVRATQFVYLSNPFKELKMYQILCQGQEVKTFFLFVCF